MSESRSSPKKVKAALRRQGILKQRAAGLTMQQIADANGISRRRARDIVDKELDKVREEVAEVARDLRTEARLRLLSVINTYLGRALGLATPIGNHPPDPKAAEVYLKAEAQLAKLEGLDAPAKVQHVASTVDGMSEAELREEARRHGILPREDVPAAATG